MHQYTCICLKCMISKVHLQRAHSRHIHTPALIGWFRLWNKCAISNKVKRGSSHITLRPRPGAVSCCHGSSLTEWWADWFQKRAIHENDSVDLYACIQYSERWFHSKAMRFSLRLSFWQSCFVTVVGCQCASAGDNGFPFVCRLWYVQIPKQILQQQLCIFQKTENAHVHVHTCTRAH